MQLYIVACLVAIAAAGRLENTYLPPHSATGAGGSGNFLSSPFKGSPFGKGAAPAPAHSGNANYGKSADANAQILRFDNNNDGLGSYSYNYETENRIQAQEAGQLKNAGSDAESLSAQGSYSYTGPDGATYSVTYIADENGFQPIGDHLPTSPPIPEAILKSLELNAAEEAAGARSSPASGGGASGQYQQPASFSMNFGAPSQQSFSSKSGYKY